MSVELAILLFIAHYIGDFLLQNREIAENKSERLDYLTLHGVLVYLPIAIVLALASKTEFSAWISVLAAIVYTLLHMVQDRFIWRYFKNRVIYHKWERGDATFNKWFFRILGLDQMLHMIVLFGIAFILFL